jgi:lysophospholipase L1-like esterase
MSRTHAVVRGALLVGVVGALYACTSDADVLGPTPVDPLFSNFVAIGNSITAGFQSDGINDSTQQRSYALFLAKQAMRTRYSYPSLAMPGCKPPISNTQTGDRVSNTVTCALRNVPRVNGVAVAPSSLNNVAVPGLGTADVTALGTDAPRNNALTQLILGGKTMVQKALEVQPTFATIWMGNNDILAPALGGLPAGATPVSTFIANYAKMMNEFTTGAPGVKGVLIGVVQVTGVPLLFRAAVLQDPQAIAAATQVAGRPVFLDPVSCTGEGLQALIAVPYIIAIRDRPAAVPGIVFCAKQGGSPDPGDIGILDVEEQATVTNLINGYNAYIKAKADTAGFAYWDPNPLFAQLHTTGAIPPFPNFGSTTQTFGQYISLDGIHPSTLAHQTIANELISVINTKYGTKLAPIPLQ